MFICSSHGITHRAYRMFHLFTLLVTLHVPMQIHFAEEWNELHHLQIMESLGGDQYWVDRFAAQHAAVFYYWVLVFFFAFSPELAYIFSELVEVRHELCVSG